MKLYTYPSAPNPRRVHIFAAEKGIDLPCQQVDIMKRENREPAFMENVNVMGGLPVLELDDGSHVAESVAICRYLEALHPEPPMFGVTPEEQARIEMWLRRIELNFMVPVGMVWVHGSPLTAGVVKKQLPEAAEQYRNVVRGYFGFLDRQLATREFIAGASFTMADIVAFCTAEFAANLNQLEHSPEQVHYARWLAGVSSRPSAKG